MMALQRIINMTDIEDGNYLVIDAVIEAKAGINFHSHNRTNCRWLQLEWESHHPCVYVTSGCKHLTVVCNSVLEVSTFSNRSTIIGYFLRTSRNCYCLLLHAAQTFVTDQNYIKHVLIPRVVSIFRNG